jgi:RNA polymerase sigma-70 factor, ECF subfamily
VTWTFEAQRRRLTRLAYRMLGSVAEAEDVVQEAWIRWNNADRSEVAAPDAWMNRAVANLCLDHLRSEKRRRAAYKGPWLPEPLIEAGPEDPIERAEDVSVAFLLALQRLSPLERAAFLLHDVFGEDHAALAETLGRTEAAARQLVSRARAHLREAKPRFNPPAETVQRLLAAFLVAAARDDAAALAGLLAEDCILITDGGGRRKAALRPLIGRADVIALIHGLRWRGTGVLDLAGLRLARINGAPGLLLKAADGLATLAVEVDADERIAAVYIVRNPDKLTHASCPGGLGAA